MTKPVDKPGRAASPGRAALVDAAPLFAALGDPSRLALVARLCTAGPQSIARLTEGGDISRQAVSKHLRVLAAAGVLRSTSDGRERIFAIQARKLAEVSRYLQQISTQWDDAIARLRALVEDDDRG